MRAMAWMRTRPGIALVWIGFVAATSLATMPVWGPVAFGREPGWEDLMALSAWCLGRG
ncbi:hypothetical protein [Muricoccus radiodurans]|uniref:hypothetical protein n=1 Tax=Muricoccus radiodurans TaxID=2231721 RepID=UPI003CF6C9E5